MVYACSAGLWVFVPVWWGVVVSMGIFAVEGGGEGRWKVGVEGRIY